MDHQALPWYVPLETYKQYALEVMPKEVPDFISTKTVLEKHFPGLKQGHIAVMLYREWVASVGKDSATEQYKAARRTWNEGLSDSES